MIKVKYSGNDGGKVQHLKDSELIRQKTYLQNSMIKMHLLVVHFLFIAATCSRKFWSIDGGCKIEE